MALRGFRCNHRFVYISIRPKTRYKRQVETDYVDSIEYDATIPSIFKRCMCSRRVDLKCHRSASWGRFHYILWDLHRRAPAQARRASNTRHCMLYGVGWPKKSHWVFVHAWVRSFHADQSWESALWGCTSRRRSWERSTRPSFSDLKADSYLQEPADVLQPVDISLSDLYAHYRHCPEYLSIISFWLIIILHSNLLLSTPIALALHKFLIYSPNSGKGIDTHSCF